MTDRQGQFKKLDQLLSDGLITQTEFVFLRNDLMQNTEVEEGTAIGRNISQEDQSQLLKLNNLLKDELINDQEYNLLRSEITVSSVVTNEVTSKTKPSVDQASASVEMLPEDKKKSKGVVIVLAALSLVGILLFVFKNEMGSEKAVAVEASSNFFEEDYGGGCIFAGRSVIRDSPSDTGNELTTLNFGSSFSYMDDNKVSVDEDVFRKVRAGGAEGWIKVQKAGLQLICSEAEVNSISELFNGPFKGEALAEIPAYVKWALRTHAQTNQISFNCNLDSIQEFVFLRSRLNNRRSSEDKRNDIHDEPKDAFFLNNISNDRQELLMFNFRSYSDWQVKILPLPVGVSCIGLRRVKRRSGFELIDPTGQLQQIKLAFDACKVITASNAVFYLYGPDGTMERYTPSKGGVFPSFTEFKTEVVDSIGADFYCYFNNYYYAVSSNLVLHESVEGVDLNREVLFIDEELDLSQDSEEIDLYYSNGDYSHTLTILNETFIAEEEYGTQEYPRTCVMQKENWRATLSGGGFNSEEDRQPVDEAPDVQAEIKVLPPPPVTRPNQPAPPVMGKQNNEIYGTPDVNASFPGGMEVMQKWLSNNLVYPQTSQEMNEQGRVYVSFVIEKDGSVTSAKVVRGVSPDLNKEALRVVKKMPKWIPAENNGRIVRSSFTLPINFQLN